MMKERKSSNPALGVLRGGVFVWAQECWPLANPKQALALILVEVAGSGAALRNFGFVFD
jgi:hypothetical protein